MDLFFDSDMVNPLLKTNARGDRRFNFVIFVVWSAIIVGRWLVVAWGGNSCFSPAEISSLVLLVLFTEGTSSGFRPWVVCGTRDAVIIRERSITRKN